jgi:hypothetical protein
MIMAVLRRREMLKGGKTAGETNPGMVPFEGRRTLICWGKSYKNLSVGSDL